MSRSHRRPDPKVPLYVKPALVDTLRQPSRDVLPTGCPGGWMAFLSGWYLLAESFVSVLCVSPIRRGGVYLSRWIFGTGQALARQCGSVVTLVFAFSSR